MCASYQEQVLVGLSYIYSAVLLGVLASREIDHMSYRTNVVRLSAYRHEASANGVFTD
jgi:hypothetical protein